MGITFTFFIGTVGIYAFFCRRIPDEPAGKGGDEERQRQSGDRDHVYRHTCCDLCALFHDPDRLSVPETWRRPAGRMTYSQYAHQGFWQLLFVSIINFLAVLVCMQVFGENKILEILLCVISVCTCVMILSAAYRMLLYVEEYDLTFLRVLVLWFLAVLMLIFSESYTASSTENL